MFYSAAEFICFTCVFQPPAPILSQFDDIDPNQFCNGDNRPPDCGPNCMCTHKVDIPLNAIVEVVLVDEVQQDNLSHPLYG